MIKISKKASAAALVSSKSTSHGTSAWLSRPSVNQVLEPTGTHAAVTQTTHKALSSETSSTLSCRLPLPPASGVGSPLHNLELASTEKENDENHSRTISEILCIDPHILLNVSFNFKFLKTCFSNRF